MWKGEAPFFMVYWLFATLILSIQFSTKVINHFVPSIEATIFPGYLFKGYFLLLEPALLVFWVIVLIKCSDNIKFKGWAVIAGLSIIPIFFYRMHFYILFSILTGKI